MQWCKRMIKYPLNVTIDTNVFEANKFQFIELMENVMKIRSCGA